MESLPLFGRGNLRVAVQVPYAGLRKLGGTFNGQYRGYMRGYRV